MDNVQELTEIKGLSENKVDKMLEAARKLDVGSGWMTGTAVFEQVTGVLCIFFELQSYCPPNPLWYEFFRERGISSRLLQAVRLLTQSLAEGWRPNQLLKFTGSIGNINH